MAIDSREKRQSIASIGGPYFGVGVTPNSSQDAEWRQEAGWSYSGIAATVSVTTGVHKYWDGSQWVTIKTEHQDTVIGSTVEKNPSVSGDFYIGYESDGTPMKVDHSNMPGGNANVYDVDLTYDSTAGGGSTENSVAIQNAIDAAQTAGSGDVVLRSAAYSDMANGVQVSKPGVRLIGYGSAYDVGTNDDETTGCTLTPAAGFTDDFLLKFAPIPAFSSGTDPWDEGTPTQKVLTGVGLDGVFLDCNDLVNKGLVVFDCPHSTFKNFNVRKSVTHGLYIGTWVSMHKRAWETGIVYAAYSIADETLAHRVTHGGSTYYCNTGHTSATGTAEPGEAGAAGAMWTLETAGTEDNDALASLSTAGDSDEHGTHHSTFENFKIHNQFVGNSSDGITIMSSCFKNTFKHGQITHYEGKGRVFYHGDDNEFIQVMTQGPRSYNLNDSTHTLKGLAATFEDGITLVINEIVVYDPSSVTSSLKYDEYNPYSATQLEFWKATKTILLDTDPATTNAGDAGSLVQLGSSEHDFDVPASLVLGNMANNYKFFANSFRAGLVNIFNSTDMDNTELRQSGMDHGLAWRYVSLSHDFISGDPQASHRILSSDDCVFTYDYGNGVVQYPVSVAPVFASKPGLGFAARNIETSFTDGTSTSVDREQAQPYIQAGGLFLDDSGNQLRLYNVTAYTYAGSQNWGYMDTITDDFKIGIDTTSNDLRIGNVVGGGGVRFDDNVGIGADSSATVTLTVSKTYTTGDVNLIETDVTNNSATVDDYVTGHTATARYTNAANNTNANPGAAVAGFFLANSESGSGTTAQINALTSYAQAKEGCGTVTQGIGSRTFVRVENGTTITRGYANYARDAKAAGTGAVTTYAQYYGEKCNLASTSYFAYLNNAEDGLFSGALFSVNAENGNIATSGTFTDGTGTLSSGAWTGLTTVDVSTDFTVDADTVLSKNSLVAGNGGITIAPTGGGVTIQPASGAVTLSASDAAGAEVTCGAGVNGDVTLEPKGTGIVDVDGVSSVDLATVTDGSDAHGLHFHNSTATIYKSGNQLITTTETTVTVVTLDTAHTTLPSGFSIVSNGIQCATAGTYLVSFNLCARDDGATADELQVIVYVDGASGYPASRADFASGGTINLSGSATVTTAGVNEVIDLRVDRESLSDYRVWGFYTSLTVTRLD